MNRKFVLRQTSILSYVICSDVIWERTALGTGRTLAVLLHYWDEQTFAPTSATTQFDPFVWTGRASQEAFRDDEVGLALMYPAHVERLLLAIMDIRAHPFS